MTKIGLRFEIGKQGFSGLRQHAPEYARGGEHMMILEKVNQFAQFIRIGGVADRARKQRALNVTVGAHLDRHELGIRRQRIATEMAARNIEGNDFCQTLVAYGKTRKIGKRGTADTAIGGENGRKHTTQAPHRQIWPQKTAGLAA